MKISKRDIRLKDEFDINDEVENFDEKLISNKLIKDINNVSYEGTVFYDGDDDVITIDGTIDYSIQAIDARDGNEVTHEDQNNWSDEYCLDDKTKLDMNVISGEEVDFDALAIEQINADIPINFTHNHGIISKTGSGWELMTEEEFNKSKENQPDPRWDKLKEFSSTDNKKDN